MTDALEKAFAKAAALPDSIQDQLAEQLSEEIAGESAWEQTLAGSQEFLEGLAAKARDAHQQGKTVNKNYRPWKADTHHPGLEFKRVGMKSPVYSVRVGIGWRALGLKQDDTVLWFWIGSHAEYDGLLRNG